MPKKRINANFYTISGYKMERIPKEDKERLKDDPYWKNHDYWLVEKSLPDGRLYSGWGVSHPTKITAEDLPPDYMLTHNHKKRGYIRTAGVVSLVYKPSPFHNHTYKDDFVYISYTKDLSEYDLGWGENSVYWHCDEYLFGSDIVDFIFAVEKNSPGVDVTDIKRRMVEQYNAYCDEMTEMGWQGNYKHIETLEELRHEN